MATFDTARLLSQIIIKGCLPDGAYENQELLDLAYDALLSEIVPIVIARREEYYVRYVDFTLTSGQASYEIPYRALGGSLRDVKLLNGNTIAHVDRIDPKKIDRVEIGGPYRFYIEGNNIVLWPTPQDVTATLRMYYFLRPSRLVQTSDCGQITAINGQVVTCSLPTAWTVNSTFDFVKGKPGYDIISMDESINAIDSGASTLTFNAALPSTLAVGDWVCLAEETCFPYLPPEGHIALIQCAVTSALEAMGDPAQAGSAQKAELQKRVFENLINFRVQSEPKLFKTRVL